jgi:hypothetical protein
MAGDASKVITALSALQPNLVQSLDAGGFTIGSQAPVNSSGQTFQWVALKGGPALNIGSYLGDGTDNRPITGVGFQPAWVMTLGDGEDAWFRPGTVSGDASFAIDALTKVSDRIQALQTDGFQVGSNVNVNKSGVTYHYVAFRASAAVHQTTYTGNSVDGTSVTGVGFQPAFIWIKRDLANNSIWRSQSVIGDLSLFWNAVVANTNRIQALEADGFQLGSTSAVNDNGDTYHYLALRDSP